MPEAPIPHVSEGPIPTHTYKPYPLAPRFQALTRSRTRRCLRSTNYGAQDRPYDRPLHFWDIVLFVCRSGFLDKDDSRELRRMCPYFDRHGPCVFETYLTRPWCPHRARRFGFGRASITQCVSHREPDPLMLVHYVWRYLDFKERATATRVHPVWYQYAHGRALADRKSVV